MNHAEAVDVIDRVDRIADVLGRHELPAPVRSFVLAELRALRGLADEAPRNDHLDSRGEGSRGYGSRAVDEADRMFRLAKT